MSAQSFILFSVALQREQSYLQANPGLERNSIISPLHLGESWPTGDALPERTAAVSPTPSKKKNGIKKIWKLVTGSSKHTSDAKGERQPRSLDRGEDDAPLAPPPPLSYLVDRERGISNRRHLSTPSLPSTVSPNGPSVFPHSPPTAPTSANPSPTSSRQGAADKDSASDNRKDSGNHHSDQELEARTPSVQRHSPDPDSRGRSLQGSLSKASGTAANSTLMPPSNRPLSVAIRRDKSLPPIPGAGESTIEFPNHPLEIRPQTMYDTLQLPQNPNGVSGPYNDFLPPQAPFRTAEARRQSFGGLGSKPHPVARTVPTRGMPPPLLLEGGRYTEFGASQTSLTAGQWASSPHSPRTETPTQKPKWRRSRFGLSTLFGKGGKTQDGPDSAGSLSPQPQPQVHSPVQPQQQQSLPVNSHAHSNGSGDLRISATASDVRSESGYGRPDSVHSSTAPRMSVASRKNLVELVEQDAEFVAYRYPSSEQRLDLAR